MFVCLYVARRSPSASPDGFLSLPPSVVPSHACPLPHCSACDGGQRLHRPLYDSSERNSRGDCSPALAQHTRVQQVLLARRLDLSCLHRSLTLPGFISLLFYVSEVLRMASHTFPFSVFLFFSISSPRYSVRHVCRAFPFSFPSLSLVPHFFFSLISLRFFSWSFFGLHFVGALCKN